MTFSDEWHALGREAEFAAESMAIGVTALGNADYTRIANYVQMLFSLSSGLERATKLALYLEYLVEHGEYPTDQHIRKHGHNLQGLLVETDRIGKTFCAKDHARLPNSSISNNIIKILSDFATNLTRYYNFSFLSDTVDSDSYDPVEMWHREVSEVVLQKHLTDRSRRRIANKAQALGRVIEPFTVVMHSREDRSPIRDVSLAMELSDMSDFEKRYTRMYILQICRFVANVIVAVANAAEERLAERDQQKGQMQAHIPNLIEIFGLFLSDDAHFKSRKTWSIYRL